MHRGHEVVVDLSRQHAWLCRHGRQVLSTPVTTGAVKLGDATPTGRWRVYDKQRNTTLHPAAGGAYPVHYWMPYSGPYGLHDAPWQKFPFGSKKYRRHGSHGCVHMPEAAMKFLYHWAPVGTTVLIRR